jgi:hypothetical protein
MSKPEKASVNQGLKNRVMQIGRQIESATIAIRKREHQYVILLSYDTHNSGIHKFISEDQS